MPPHKAAESEAKITKTNRQLKGFHTLTLAGGQPRGHPGTGFAASTLDDQELLATSAFVYTRKPTPRFLFLLDGEPINIGTENQTLTAELTVETDLRRQSVLRESKVLDSLTPS